MLTDDLPIYIFDGTFYGLLTAVFESYERKHPRIQLCCRETYAPEFFSGHIDIHSDKVKAQRVWKGLQQKVAPVHLGHFYKAFFSEQAAIHLALFRYARYIFDHPAGHDFNYGHEDVLTIAQMSQRVHREKHRMEAFVRFKKSGNGLFFAVISPDYNVLPLISKHFRNRYADQPWLIYDERRKYGIHYDLHTLHEVTIDLAKEQAIAEQDAVVIDGQEELFTLLWKDYFRSTNIAERRNIKLHIQHVPKRYWRYLTEKEGKL